jgi:hypothetical protein
MALTLTMAVGVHAQWIGSSTAYSNYNDPDNWEYGIINDQFVPVSGSAYGWTAAYGVNISGTRVLPGNFVYNNADAVNFSITPLNSVWRFASAAPVIQVGMASTAVWQTFTFGAPSRDFVADLEGKDLTFDIDPAYTSNLGNNRDVFNNYATLVNVRDLNKISGGTLVLYQNNMHTGTAASLSGNFTVSGGRVQVYAPVLGAQNLNIVNQGVIVDLMAAGTIPLLDLATNINLYNGALNLVGANSQEVGAVTLKGSHSVIGTANGNNVLSAPKTLTLSSLTRENFGTVVLFGNSVSGGVGNGNNFIQVTDNTNILGALVGGGGATGSTNISVIPWIAAVSHNDGALGNTDNARWRGEDLVTYTASGGFRMLTPGEYYNASATVSATSGLLANAAVTDNVALIDATYDLTVSQTINALKVAAHTTATISGGQTLTIASGAIVAGGNNLTAVGGGAISSGTNPFIIYGRSTINLEGITLTNDITDPNTAGFINANTVNISGSNSWGGMTLVRGRLTLGNSLNGGRAVLPNATELRIERDGTLNVNNALARVRKLSGVGTIITANGSLTVGADATEAVTKTIRVGAGGILAPGDISGDYQAGTLMVGANFSNFIIDNGATLEWDIAGDTLSDQLAFSGTLTINSGGTLALNYLNDYTPTAGEEDTTFTWTLATGFASVSGDAANLTISDALHPDWVLNENGYGYSLLFDNNNLILTLTLEAVPEPSTWLLLATGVGLLAFLRRRR